MQLSHVSGAAPAIGILVLLALPLAVAPVEAEPEWPGEPYLVTWGFHSAIPCAAVVAGPSAGELCTALADGVPGTGEASPTTFQLLHDPGWSGLAYSLRSEEPLDFALPPSLQVSWDEPAGVIPLLAGPPPLRAEAQFTPDQPFTQHNGTAVVHVGLDPQQAPQVAYERAFTLCVAFFYNGHPVSADDCSVS